MSARIYLEGGGDSKELHVRCREGFRKLLERCGFKGRMPHLIACGGRNDAYDDFKTAHTTQSDSKYIAMLIDSEEPVDDIDAPWQHLNHYDGWDKPDRASDSQVLFMTTCMETWIISDRETLASHYGSKLQSSALPALDDIESRSRHDVHEGLAHATRHCSNAYTKGKRSFEVLGKLSPPMLTVYLPSFRRAVHIFEERL